MTINPGDLSIKCVADCSPSFEVYRRGSDRITNGPLDLYGGGNIHPLEIMTNASNYYFLEHDASGGPNGGKDEIVGYMRVSRDNNNDIECVNVEEFEIFREYRNKGYGKLFAKLLHSYFSICSNYSDCYVFIHGMKFVTFVFWWSAVPELFFQMFSLALGYQPEKLNITDEEREARIDSFFAEHPQNDDAVKEIMKIIAKRFIIPDDNNDNNNEGDIKYIESHPLFKSMKEQIAAHKCRTCFTTKVNLLLCNGNGHKFCKECMERMVKEKMCCPLRYSDSPLEIYKNQPASCIYDITLADVLPTEWGLLIATERDAFVKEIDGCINMAKV